MTIRIRAKLQALWVLNTRLCS